MNDDWEVNRSGQIVGPIPGDRLRQAIGDQIRPSDLVRRVGDDTWLRADEVAALAAVDDAEPIPLSARKSPSPSRSVESARWRNIAYGGVGGLLFVGAVALIGASLGDGPPTAPEAAAAVEAVECSPCEPWQRCGDEGRCVDLPRDQHLQSLEIASRFAVGQEPGDLTVVGEDVIVSTSRGVEVHRHELITVVPGVRRASHLVPVGRFTYATEGSRVFVIDSAQARLVARMELSGEAGRPVPVAGRERVLVPLDDRQQVAVLYPPLHGVLPSVPFDAIIGSVAASPSGRRALAVAGRERQVVHRLFGYRIPTGRTTATGSAAFAFDPERPAFQADHTRIEVGEHPWHAVFVSEDHALIALRGENTVVPVRWTDDGVASGRAVPTCAEPDRLVRRPRGAETLVRCARGLALVGADGTQIRRWELAAATGDIAVSPDGAAAYVALAAEGEARPAVAAIDLDSDAVTRHELDADPIALAIFEDGETLAVLAGTEVVLLGATRERSAPAPAIAAGDLDVRVTTRARLQIGGTPTSVAIGGDPEIVVIGTGTSGEVIVADPGTAQIRWRLRAAQESHSVHIVHDRWITSHALISRSRSISVWDLREERPEGEPPTRHELSVGQNLGDVLALEDGRSMLVSAVQSRLVKRFDLVTMQETGSVQLPRAVAALVGVSVRGRPHAALMGGVFRFNFMGRTWASGAWVEILDLEAEPFGARRRSLSAGQQPRTPAVLVDGSALLFPDRMSNQITRVQIDSTDAPETVGVGEQPEQVVILPDGRRALSIDQGSNTLTEITLEPLERVHSIRLEHSPGEVVVSDRGYAAVVQTDGYRGHGTGLVLVAGDPLRIVARGETGRAPYALAVNDAGTVIVTADSGSGTATFIDVEMDGL